MEALHANYYGRKIKSRKKVLGRRKGKTPAKKRKRALPKGIKALGLAKHHQQLWHLLS